MSLKAKRTPLAIRRRNQIELADLLFEEGVDIVRGRLEDIFRLSSRDLSIEEIDEILAMDWKWASWEGDEKRFEAIIDGKTPGAKWIAGRIRKISERGSKLVDMPALLKEWGVVRDLRRWAKTCKKDILAYGLGHLEYKHPDGKWRVSAFDWRHEDPTRLVVSTGALMSLGIKWDWEAERFLNLYKEVMNSSRSWGSCFQVPQKKVLQIATTPNYNRLPLWVKKTMVNAGAFTVTERIGNIWRLKDCARAWKWHGGLPKGIAEKVGRLSVKSRLLAAVAFESVTNSRWDQHRQQGWETPRSELTQKFWETFKKLHRMSFPELLSLLRIEYGLGLKGYTLNRIEILLDLPFGTLQESSCKVKSARNEAELFEGIGRFLTPEKACQTLFGASGKATVKAFQGSALVARRWAAALAYGNADLLQKYFRVTNCIEFEEDAISFLKSLSPEVALRMIQTTEFKVRGEVHPVDLNLVRDTGYLFTKLQEGEGGVPNLGRVRCWLTCHETFSKEYVKRLPDFELQVNRDFAPLQGLCAVDGSWEIEIPTRNAQLKLWGEQLSHCVGGYGEAVNSGRSIILAVREHGWVTHTVEMTPSESPSEFPYSCQQFYGYGNSEPPDVLRQSVLGALAQAGLC